MTTMSERPTILILGCFHKAQPQPQEVVGSFWNDYRVAFAQVLKDLLEKYPFKAIGEEAQQGIITSAAVAAKRCGIPYTNIDIPLSVQNQLKVRPPHGMDPATGRYTTFEGTEKYRLAWDLVREYHMYETFLEFQRDQSPSLLICGMAHLHGLRVLLSPQFEIEVESFDCTDTGLD